MFYVTQLMPSDRFCGGNTSTDDLPAKRAAAYPWGIAVTKYKPKDFRMLKTKRFAKQFFRQLKANPRDYVFRDMGWAFETREEAVKKLQYEAENCDLYVYSNNMWIRC